MPRLKQTAAQQAAAEYGPQKAAVRRGVRGQSRSIRSMQPALEEGIQTTEQQLRHSGLAPRDLHIALAELAKRNLDVASSTALQVGGVHRAGHEELVDLNQAQGASQRSILSQLQAAQAEQHQQVQQEIAGEQRGLATDIRKEQIFKELGLGSYADDGNDNALTPTQQRAKEEAHDSAAHYAKSYFQAAKQGVKDPDTGEVTHPVPPNPHHWDESVWDALISKVESKAGSYYAAKKAVRAIRDHVEGNEGAAGDIMRQLGFLAATGTAAAGPDELRPVAQFAAGLLGRK